MRGNIVTATFNGQEVTKTEPIYQYDYGQLLQFTDLELPEAYEVQFSNYAHDGTSLTAIGNSSCVEIPDEVLKDGHYVYAFVFLHHTEDDGETEYKITIPVIKRPDIEYVEPTPVQQDAITQAIAALNSAINETAQSANDADASAQAAARSEKNAKESEQNATESARQAAEHEENAGNSATNAKESETNARESQQLAEKNAQAAAQSAQAASESASQAEQYAQSADASDKSVQDHEETIESLYQKIQTLVGFISDYDEVELVKTDENGNVVTVTVYGKIKVNDIPRADYAIAGQSIIMGADKIPYTNIAKCDVRSLLIH